MKNLAFAAGGIARCVAITTHLYFEDDVQSTGQLDGQVQMCVDSQARPAGRDESRSFGGRSWGEKRIAIRSSRLADVAVTLLPHPGRQETTANLPAERPGAESLVFEDLPITGSAQIGDRLVIQYRNGTIAVEVDGIRQSVVMPVLREIAAELRMSPLNRNGNSMNTRQLGAAIIATTVRQHSA